MVCLDFSMGSIICNALRQRMDPMNTHIRNLTHRIREVQKSQFFPMQHVQLFTRPHCSILASVREFTKMEKGACTPCLLEWHEW